MRQHYAAVAGVGGYYTKDMKDMAERDIRYALIILGAILLVLAVFLVANYLSLRRAQVINAREMRASALFAHHAPLAASDAGIIRSWMTFDYVNKLFALPSEYLQAQLQINNTHYPRLTIGSYLSEVENAVRNYSAPANATGTPANGTSAPPQSAK